MAEFRETIPTISGPGAFLVVLIFLALILTSSKSRDLAFNWQFAVALVAISIPTSIFITQIYHSFFTKFGFRMKNWGEKYTKYKKNMHKLDGMVDYLSYKSGKGDKEWVIIQKRATAYHLFSMLRDISVLFLLSYFIFLFWNELYGHVISISWWGVVLTGAVAFFSTILFHLACKDVWEAWELLDRKIIKEIETDLDDWVKEEINEGGGKN